CFEILLLCVFFFFFSSRRRHTRFDCDWSSDVCSSDLRSPEAESFAICSLHALSNVGSRVPIAVHSASLAFRPSALSPNCGGFPRSEERRVGKECRSRWSADY